jgi:alkylation response protein AidB-like acyl-CoA dehydrogenase
MSASEPRFTLSARERSLRDAAAAIASTASTGDESLSRQELLALFAELRPLGYLGSVLPSAQNPGPLGFAALVEGLSPALALLGNHSVQRYLHAHGTDAQKQRFLLPLLDAASIAAIAITEPQAGADLSRLETTAERSGSTFVIRGRKTWVTHGLTADVFIVLAQTADGPTRFILPGNTPGLKRTALHVVGLKHLTFAELQFDGCTLSEDHVLGTVGKGLEGTKAAFPVARALAALQALRLGEAALEVARDYARGRHLFGRSLADSAVVQDRLADHAAKLAGARLLAYQVMTRLDAADCAVTAAEAKALACGSALEACLWATELSGSAALSTDNPLERLLRDARMMAVVDGTVALNRFVAARRLLRMEGL